MNKKEVENAEKITDKLIEAYGDLEDAGIPKLEILRQMHEFVETAIQVAEHKCLDNHEISEEELKKYYDLCGKES